MDLGWIDIKPCGNRCYLSNTDVINRTGVLFVYTGDCMTCVYSSSSFLFLLLRISPDIFGNHSRWNAPLNRVDQNCQVVFDKRRTRKVCHFVVTT